MLLISPAYAYADYASDGSGSMMGGTATATSYGADIVILQHLIELDQVSNPGYFVVYETLVLKNIGTENYTGPIFTWLPDEAFNIGVAKLTMSAGGRISPTNFFMVDDNVIGWNDTFLAGPVMTPMYRLEYVVPAEFTGKITESVTFTKKLKYSTNVNYDYVSSSGMPPLVVKLVKSDDLETKIVNEDGSQIEADSVEVVEGSMTYNWIQPQFTEISFMLKGSGVDQSQVTLYLLILLVILLVIGIPILRGKRSGIKGQDKLDRSEVIKEDEDIYWEREEEESDEELEEEVDEDFETDEDVPEDDSAALILDTEDIKSFDLDELISAKKALFKVLTELDEDYSNGALSEEEYNSLRNKYKQKAIGIMKQIDILEK
ncbi:MAG: hypothetical protein P1P80_05890 [ANME-2 cluster archaeon]|nr:hypothetical protein [ANME-2 cluster archaeon]